MAGDHDERTPLLNGNGHSNTSGDTGANGNRNGNHHELTKETKESWLVRVFGPPNTIKILLAGFIISLSFSFTQGSPLRLFSTGKLLIILSTNFLRFPFDGM